ncbi:MAG: hypothetical protein GYB66_06740 [Chloroflexi bacterium]|nr:hypothetical protein [Chloroflexota bacterium]
MRHMALFLEGHIYQRLLRPLIFRDSAQKAHTRIMRLLAATDSSPRLIPFFTALRRLLFRRQPIEIGGVNLPYPVILAAGFVKGTGFARENEALAAVQNGINIIPGWRTMPQLVGPVEFGSYTRWPRLGNPGTVIWRRAETLSTQNRVGLRNPGARAAAEFLARHKPALPEVFGINIAVSPGVDTLDAETTDTLESLESFVVRGVLPSWFTLNLSCPNTEDDPRGNQTEDKTRHLCGAAMHYLREVASANGKPIPLWVKISPGLNANQYQALLKAFVETGVGAVIATNTRGMPVPGDAALTAGVGGQELQPDALAAVQCLAQAQNAYSRPPDIIGCGGVMDSTSFGAFRQVGARAVQYYSALIYQGPFAGAHILDIRN